MQAVKVIGVRWERKIFISTTVKEHGMSRPVESPELRRESTTSGKVTPILTKNDRFSFVY